MIHLRKLARLFRRVIATVASGQGAPHSVTLKSKVAATPEPSPPHRRVDGKRLALCAIATAAFTSGCVDASPRPPDEPTVVDFVQKDGRTEISNPDVFTEQPDGPVTFRIIVDGEVVKEFAGANLAEARKKLEQASLQHIEAMAGRQDASPELRAVLNMRRTMPSSADFDRMSDEDLVRVTGMLERVLDSDFDLSVAELSELSDSLASVTAKGNE